MDYYKILEVEHLASQREIINAYRRLALKYQRKDDFKYKMIAEAYDKLIGNCGATIQQHKDYVDHEIRVNGKINYCICEINPDGYELVNYFKKKYKFKILKSWYNKDEKDRPEIENEYFVLYEFSS